jgi:hypothetical protein
MTSSEDPNTRSSAEEISAPMPGDDPAQMPRSSAQVLLPIAISAAVPLWVYEISQRGGPTADDWKRLPNLGRLIAEQGDHLLHRSPGEGGTAALFNALAEALFNALAEALALLSFVPGGVSFGEQHFDALQILAGFLGAEQAATYLARVRQFKAE